LNMSTTLVGVHRTGLGIVAYYGGKFAHKEISTTSKIATKVYLYPVQVSTQKFLSF
jgi:hypothetical protein